MATLLYFLCVMHLGIFCGVTSPNHIVMLYKLLGGILINVKENIITLNQFLSIPLSLLTLFSIIHQFCGSIKNKLDKNWSRFFFVNFFVIITLWNPKQIFHCSLKYQQEICVKHGNTTNLCWDISGIKILMKNYKFISFIMDSYNCLNYFLMFQHEVPWCQKTS